MPPRCIAQFPKGQGACDNERDSFVHDPREHTQTCAPGSEAASFCLYHPFVGEPVINSTPGEVVVQVVVGDKPVTVRVLY